MKILVTGCNGQLGRELQIAFGRHPELCAVFTDSDTLDLTDGKAVCDFLTEGAFSHIINCAAYTAVDKAEDEQGACTAVNVDAVRNLAMHAERTGASVLHISTDYVFDGSAHTPYRETDKTLPRSHYGSTKRKGETVLLGLAPESIIIRTAWLYSPTTTKNFVGAILKRAKAGQNLKVVSDQIGTPTSAADLAETIVSIITSGKWLPGIYHYTDEGVASWYDFAKAIIDISGIKDVKVLPIRTADYPTAAERPLYSVLDKSKIKNTYGIQIPYWRDSLSAALPKFVNE